jgi:hypothetical protein
MLSAHGHTLGSPKSTFWRPLGSDDGDSQSPTGGEIIVAGDAVAGTLDTEHRRAFGTPTLSGSALALLFWWQSLTPTLIPRSWETQAAGARLDIAVRRPHVACGLEHPRLLGPLLRGNGQHEA